MRKLPPRTLRRRVRSASTNYTIRQRSVDVITIRHTDEYNGSSTAGQVQKGLRRGETEEESKNERNCEGKRIELKGDTVREYFRRARRARERESETEIAIEIEGERRRESRREGKRVERGYFSRRLRNWRVESLISRQADGSLCRASATPPPSLSPPLDLPVQPTPPPRQLVARRVRPNVA